LTKNGQKSTKSQKSEIFEILAENLDFRENWRIRATKILKKRDFLRKSRFFCNFGGAGVPVFRSKLVNSLSIRKTGTPARPKSAESSLRSQSARFWPRGCASFPENLRFSALRGGFTPPLKLPPSAQKLGQERSFCTGFAYLRCFATVFSSKIPTQNSSNGKTAAKWPSLP